MQSCAAGGPRRRPDHRRSLRFGEVARSFNDLRVPLRHSGIACSGRAICMAEADGIGRRRGSIKSWAGLRPQETTPGLDRCSPKRPECIAASVRLGGHMACAGRAGVHAAAPRGDEPRCRERGKAGGGRSCGGFGDGCLFMALPPDSNLTLHGRAGLRHACADWTSKAAAIHDHRH
jgi:hypothetical protein